ncbi:TlpA family protein disulfide reductase [Paeniglutamicibacter gangotriensis]|uniref:Alkyl hydroperoxide reductase n=1 Tax=Paeniglutamicibacter gangotriensis Lz1y TaxID=1276920 RepID=M7MR97_9MICC|nr:TlpA disulfide reductase family protein [Paeniglutamicibacter gangotriensis]EMQ98912.1 alkyl hydroperoxide reductase [Paeniglutamicibacter gangotriensis Lz1y]
MTDPISSQAQRLGRRTFLRAAMLGAAVLPLAACVGEEDPLAKQAREGNNKNYIAGDGSVQEYGPESRTEPVEIEAVAYDGQKIDSADWIGQVTVLNFWYAACAPCRIEAPHLVELSKEFDGKAEFLGINVRDEKEAAEAFERTFGIKYPSVQDTQGTIQLAMTKYVPLKAVPTTLVIDKQGRVSARILGVAEKATLKALITTALAETL